MAAHVARADEVVEPMASDLSKDGGDDGGKVEETWSKVSLLEPERRVWRLDNVPKLLSLKA